MKKILLPVVPAALIALLASPALATSTMAADIDGGFAVGRAASWNGATVGMKARAGYEFRPTKDFFLGPEGGFGVLIISDVDGIADGSAVLPAGPSLYRMLGGLRSGLRAGDDGSVIPSLFVHGGYTWILASGEGAKFARGPMLDVGLAFDFTVSPRLRIGGHAGFGAIWAGGYDGPFTGIHAGITFTLTTDRSDLAADR